MERVHAVQDLVQHNQSITIVGTASVLLALFYLCGRENPVPGFPIVSVQHKGWRVLLPQSLVWILDGKKVLATGFAKHPDGFQIKATTGYRIILPNRYAHELRNHPHLSLTEAFQTDLMVEYPGFDSMRLGLRDEKFIGSVIKERLTQSLGPITGDVVDEMASAIYDAFGNSYDWTTREIKNDVLEIVARASSRVFLGKKLARNRRLLVISKDHTIDMVMASEQLRLLPSVLRPVIYWLIPACTRLRKEVHDAKTLIVPEIAVIRNQMQQAIDSGAEPPKMTNAIAWMIEKSEGHDDADFVAGQLALSSAAIHTTSETLCRCIAQICETPEIVQPLREEIISVLAQEGWSRTALPKLQLLDSFLKEVHRFRPLSLTSMYRLVKKPVSLNDGTLLPAGTRLKIDDTMVHDSTLFSNAGTFEVARFQRLRKQSGEEHQHQFVSLTPDIMAFGYGRHACPGRFFASHELKIALCVLLLQYDIRSVPDADQPRNQEFENFIVVAPTMKVQLRRRTEEFDLTSTAMYSGA
ncbi:hypothetical protein M409DRAFT_61961 [Zasmidium cellare ATCC 36951]|uniref:Cytochrome P450 n=1 Tax=Zasmidium cellare ATCC 36951 TaxID=1080233 RepID=A0A6A6D2M8_ZASCE|nr:uncharacterized protein M409DRAFT_61961 [Zasmidium cellare ATCC 36951]KAF2173631.1 hypothetical protein M409DRAFT_61961 [Zasmidium cellare ATCC 36951]